MKKLRTSNLRHIIDEIESEILSTATDYCEKTMRELAPKGKTGTLKEAIKQETIDSQTKRVYIDSKMTRKASYNDFPYERAVVGGTKEFTAKAKNGYPFHFKVKPPYYTEAVKKRKGEVYAFTTHHPEREGNDFVTETKNKTIEFIEKEKMNV